MNIAILNNPLVHKTLHKLSKYAPEILTGIGVVGTVAAGVLAVKATTNLEPVIARHEAKRDQVRNLENMHDEETGLRVYSDAQITRELVKVYGRTVVDLTKLYGPAVTLELGSLVSILAAHGIMRRRVVTLLGAYKAIEASFASYRQGVIAEYGEEKDRDLRLGYTTQTIEDPDTGKKKKVRSLGDPNKVGMYAIWFDEGNPNWTDVPFYNLNFLKNAQAWMNDKLRIQGFLFLSTVYEYLGFNIADHPEAQLVGWTMEPGDGGDLHVDFDLYNADNREFINGIAPGVLLDFNVDGVIIDKIGNRRGIGIN